MAAPALTAFQQGVGAANADNFNTWIQGGVLLAQLRLFQGAWSGQIVYLGGYASSGDGGQGFFWWNSTSTAADNGNSVIVPYGTVGYGAWLRIGGGTGSAFRYISSGSSDTATVNDVTIVWNSTAAAPKTEVLPAASTMATGATITIKDAAQTAAQYPITVTSPGSTIDFSSSFTINQNGMFRNYRSDGVSNWVVV